MEEEQAKAMVSFIQAQKTPDYSLATIRVGREDVTIPAGKTFCVPPSFDPSNPVVLYESPEESTSLEQLSIGEGLLEISKRRWPLVQVTNFIEMGETMTQQVELPGFPPMSLGDHPLTSVILL